jgi:hypothetical protein
VKSHAAVAAFLSATFAVAAARADAATMFGQGARSAGVARADTAGGGATDAPRVNAALAAEPGTRARIGYGYAALGLDFNGRDLGVAHVSGVELAVQGGGRVSKLVTIGAALAIHLPDPYLAAIAFRPATEPQFVLYEAPLQRTTVDFAAAVRVGPVAIGGGVAAGLGVGGAGTAFTLGQDGGGTFADAGLDVALPYRFAPLFGARVELGRAVLAASIRGSTAIDLRLDNAVAIRLNDNPLNGTTTVRVRGSAAYDPATIDVGARVALGGGLSLLGAIEYAVYSASPAPIAEVSIDVHLGTTPGLRAARVFAPGFHDTVSPRVGAELRRPSADDAAWRWAVRAGYARVPSPVPDQQGFTTFLDSTRHEIAIGGGYHLGRLAGVDLAIEVAAQVHVLTARAEEKPSASLPYAQLESSGTIVHGAATLEAAWR